MDEATATTPTNTVTATSVTATSVTATSVTATSVTANAIATSSDRTKAERQAQVKPILEKLTELKLYASKFAAVKELMVQIQDYVANGEPQKVNIVFPEFGRRIKGTLETNRHVESSVKLSENLRFSEPFPSTARHDEKP
jgi:hypothetical protein